MQVVPVTHTQLFTLAPDWARKALMKAITFGQVTPWAPPLVDDADLAFDLISMDLQEIRIDGTWYVLEDDPNDRAYMLPNNLSVMFLHVGAVEEMTKRITLCLLADDSHGMRIIAKRGFAGQAEVTGRFGELEEKQWKVLTKRIPSTRLRGIVMDVAGPFDGLSLGGVMIRPDKGVITDTRSCQYGNVVVTVALVETDEYDSILFAVFHFDQLLYLEHVMGPKGEVFMDDYLSTGGSDWIVDIDNRT